MQLYFIRHAQSENNALWEQTGSSQGRSSDPKLTAAGHQQANLLAQFLSHEPAGHSANRWDPQNRSGFGLSHLYTSLMVRAVATAVPLARALKLSLQAWPDAHEIGGIYLDDEQGIPVGMAGKDRSYFMQNYPDLQLGEQFSETGWWNRPYEPDEDAWPRARRLMEQLLERHGDSQDQVGLVSHGGFYNALLSVMFGFGPSAELWLLMNNAAITRLDIQNGRIELVYHNRVDYLPDHLVT
jgi:2,3-bisphosphoglycerate-dependent phosphoglycerate mutase